MTEYGAGRILFAALGIAGAVACVVLYPGEIYWPTYALVVGSAGFSSVLLGETDSDIRGYGRAGQVATLLFMTALFVGFYGLFAVAGAWGIEWWFDLEPGPILGVLMALPAAIIGTAGAIVGWQQNRLELATASLARTPSAAVADRLARRARRWTIETQLETCDVLIEHGFPGKVEIVLEKRESFEDHMRAQAVPRLALARAERGQLAEARAALAEQHLDAPDYRLRYDLVKARIKLAEGDPEGALELLGDRLDVDELPRGERPIAARLDRVLRARAHADAGHIQQAHAALQAIREQDGNAALERLARGDDRASRMASELLHGSPGAPFR